MRPNRRFGRGVLYTLCLAPAALMLAYYFLEYIPAQREYFTNLRFRALANIGDQFRVKIQRLASSLESATKSDGHAAQYIAAMVPELNYLNRKCPPPGSPSIEFGNRENTVRFYSGNKCPAEASLSQIFGRLSQDDLFDDIVLADGSGRVIYQRSASSPKIASLTELRKSELDPKAAPKEGPGMHADTVQPVRLDESEFVLLTQPVRTSALEGREATLTLGGLVRLERLGGEARHVPPMYLAAIFAPLLVLFLSGPFLKILLLTRTGRLAFPEMTLLAVFSVIATALGTLLLMSWSQFLLAAPQLEPHLDDLANALNQEIVSDVKRMLGTLQQFDEALPRNIGQAKRRDRQSVLEDPSLKLTRESALFDFVFWANEDGCQIAKWTTKRVNTPRLDQTSWQHFQNVIAKRLWALPGHSDQRFTLQTLVSPTTSQPIVVLAMPSRHNDLEVSGCNDVEPSHIVSVALVAPVPSLNSSLIPPGAGFAIFEPDGRVLFHSSAERNLHENLFEEIHSPAPLREAVAMRTGRSLEAYYRGRKFQFRVQPVSGIPGIPWNIAVFRELEPRQAMIARVWGETLLLFLLVLCLIAAGFCALSIVLRVALGLSWRYQIDFVLARLWPDRARRLGFRKLAWELTAVVAVSLIAVVFGAANLYRSAGWLLPFCFLVPAGAVILVASRLWRTLPSCWDLPPIGEKQPGYIACLSLCLVLLAVVPIVGLFAIARAHEARTCLMRWQQDLVGTIQTRQSQLRGEVESSRAFDPPSKDFVRKNFLPPDVAPDISQQPQSDTQPYVSRFWNTRIRSRKAVSSDAQISPCESQMLNGDEIRLSLRCAVPADTTLEIVSSLPPMVFPRNPVWWLLTLALLGSVYAWNCLAFSRLFVLDFRYDALAMLPELRPADMRSHLLVLGLPLARKDAAVRNWLGYSAPRVNLYAAHFFANWLEETTGRLRRELTASSEPAVRFAVAGGSASESASAPPRAPWVHISNLEAKLGDPHERQIVSDLIEKLVTSDIGDVPVRLIITSAVDPVFHFDSVLSDERKKIYEHPLPEPELQRLARLLHNFRKVQVGGPGAQPPDWGMTAPGAVVFEECRHHHALLELGEEIATSPTRNLDREALLARVAERAQALYKVFWASCTRPEKLLLIQLAQTGFVNPLCLDTLEELVRKGLILPGCRPRIMNETFRRFLENVEAPQTVHEWESEGGESSWLVIRNVVLVLVALGLGVIALTQHQAMQTATAVLTAVGTVMAGMLRVVGYFTGRRPSGSEAAAESARPMGE